MISGQGIHTLSLGKAHTHEIWARHTHTKSRQSIHTWNLGKAYTH